MQVSLVPAYRHCASPNREHGPPLAFGSCAPPAPGSSHLMVGVGDGHPAPARSSGFVRLKVTLGVPGGADDTTRAIWQLDQVKVYDGGPDEDAGTEGDNGLFAVQGVFIP